MDKTNILWTDATVNFWWGCSKVSAGCKNCYAEKLSNKDGEDLWGPGKKRRHLTKRTRGLAYRLDRAAKASGTRTKAFCSSMSDWLDPEVPLVWLWDVLHTIAQTPHLDWQLLTKRPELWRTRLQAVVDEFPMTDGAHMAWGWLAGAAPDNVWLGVSVEDVSTLPRISTLLSIPASVRFVSMEPLLAPLHIDKFVGLQDGYAWHDCLCNESHPDDRPCSVCDARLSLGAASGLHWVIVGGESGPDARPCHQDWIRNIVQHCKASGIAVFVKQLGKVSLAGKDNLRYETAHPKGGDIEEFPYDLQVREFPTVG